MILYWCYRRDSICLKTKPPLKRVKYLSLAHNIGIQMKWKEPKKMMILNLKTPFGLNDLCKHISVLQGMV